MRLLVISLFHNRGFMQTKVYPLPLGFKAPAYLCANKHCLHGLFRNNRFQAYYCQQIHICQSAWLVLQTFSSTIGIEHFGFIQLFVV